MHYHFLLWRYICSCGNCDKLACFIEFADGCRYFRTPNQEQCYLSLWRQVGCSNCGTNRFNMLDAAGKRKLRERNILYGCSFVAKCLLQFFIDLKNTEINVLMQSVRSVASRRILPGTRRILSANHFFTPKICSVFSFQFNVFHFQF